MTERWALDLFCGAGGMTKGFQRAGYKVVGVDHKPQKRYCGDEFIQADALEYLATAIESGEIERFSFVHASPPCQFNLKGLNAANRSRGRKLNHVDLIPETRRLLRLSALPYVIENVQGAALLNPIKLCGSIFGLQVQRHRFFESNFLSLAPSCNHGIWKEAKYPTNFRPNGKIIKSRVVQVYGNTAGRTLWPKAMGIDWMNGDEIQQAIPPVYAEFIASEITEHLGYENHSVAA